MCETMKLDSKIAQNDLFIVKVTASWCAPCKQIHPYFVEIAKENGIVYEEIDIESDNTEDQEFCNKMSVKSLPTFIAFKRGEQVDSLVGGQKDKLKQMVENLKNMA